MSDGIVLMTLEEFRQASKIDSYLRQLGVDPDSCFKGDLNLYIPMHDGWETKVTHENGFTENFVITLDDMLFIDHADQAAIGIYEIAKDKVLVVRLGVFEGGTNLQVDVIKPIAYDGESLDFYSKVFTWDGTDMEEEAKELLREQFMQHPQIKFFDVSNISETRN